MITPRIDYLLVVRIETVSGLVIGLGERIHDQLIAFADIGCFLQLGVKIILQNTDPVKRIRKNACHLTGSCGFICGLN